MPARYASRSKEPPRYSGRLGSGRRDVGARYANTGVLAGSLNEKSRPRWNRLDGQTESALRLCRRPACPSTVQARFILVEDGAILLRFAAVLRVLALWHTKEAGIPSHGESR
jgi:hypothetical protein